MVLSKKFYQGYLVPRTGVPVPLVVPVTGYLVQCCYWYLVPWYQACVAGEYFWARLVPVPVYLVHWLCYVMLCYVEGLYYW